MADFRDYVELEVGLSTRLANAWKPYAARVYARIAEAVKAQDWATAFELANAMDLTDVLAKELPYVRAVFRTCMIHGARMVNGRAMIASLDFGHTVDKAVARFMATIEHKSSVIVADGATQLIAQAQLQAQSVKKAAKPRFLSDFVSFKRNGDAHLQLVSSLNTSRLSTWGFTAEADFLGYTEYELSAVLDGRTSEFCRLINGKRFKVQDARSSIVHLLGVENPDDLKTLAPWPKQNKAALAQYKTMNAEQLTAAGLHIPPFHPGCRTMLVKVGQAPAIIKPKNTASPEFVSDRKDFEALGVSIGEPQLNHWNSYVKANPVDILSTLSGFTPKEMVTGELGRRYRAVSFRDNGDIELRFKARAGVRGLAGGKLTFNPYTGTLYQDYLDFKNANQADARVFFRRFEDNLVATGKTLAAKEVVVAVGAGQALTYGQLGYVPLDDDWVIVRTALQESLPDIADLVKNWKAYEMQVFNLLLASNDPRSFRALVDLPFAKKAVALLFKDLQFDARLSLADPKVLSKHEGFT